MVIKNDKIRCVEDCAGSEQGITSGGGGISKMVLVYFLKGMGLQPSLVLKVTSSV